MSQAATKILSEVQLSWRSRNQLRCLEEAQITWVIGSDTLQLLSCLQAVQYAPGLQLLWAVSHSELGLSNTSICESFLCISKRTHWLTKLDFDGGILWYIMNLDEFGMSWVPYLVWVNVHVCSVSPGKKIVTQQYERVWGKEKETRKWWNYIFSF